MTDYEEACDIIMSQQRLITALTHTLNDLYDVANEINSYLDIPTRLFNDLEAALKQADKLLGGN